MSDKMGTVALEGEGGRALFGGGVEDKAYSEKVSSEIDAEVKKIIDEAYKKRNHIITEHRKLLEHSTRTNRSSSAPASSNIFTYIGTECGV
jgi:ATP-dependent Zn protease